MVGKEIMKRLTRKVQKKKKPQEGLRRTALLGE